MTTIRSMTRISLLRRIPMRMSSSLSRPSPPRLPASQQAEFERLQRAAATNLAKDIIQQEQVFPARGPPPEFDGDRNPKTGEVGGPKNEPLRWGGKGDWSYNGRVTDF